MDLMVVCCCMSHSASKLVIISRFSIVQYDFHVICPYYQNNDSFTLNLNDAIVQFHGPRVPLHGHTLCVQIRTETMEK